MNVLQLCNYQFDETNIGLLIEDETTKVINKYSIKTISIESYDAYIVTVNFLGNNLSNTSFFEKLEKQNKPIIYIYGKGCNPENSIGLKWLSKKYKIDFCLSDCSVLDPNEWRYKPNGENGEAYSMYSPQCNGFCNIKNTKQYFIIKNNNIVIMHDAFLEVFNGIPIRRPSLVKIKKFLFKNNDDIKSVVPWLNNIEIIDDSSLFAKLEENKEKLKEFEIEQENIISKINANLFYKSVLCTSGDSLVTIVKKILEEMLNISIDDMDLKKQDLYFCLDNINILVEVKGVNHPFKRENVSQVTRHVKDYAESHSIYGADVFKQCKGVLIINPYNTSDINDRITKEFYSKEVIDDIKYDNVCAIDTFTLLNYYSKWRQNNKSINMKKIILESNYIEPDFMEMIKL